MKKILSLIMALCLICLCGAALADAKVSDGDPLVLDGFTLNLDKGISYEVGTKADQQVYVTVYPYYASGDLATNFNAVWMGGPETITVEAVKEQLDGLKEEMAKGFEQYGFTVGGIEYSEPAESTLGGEACVKLDSKMTLGMNGQSLDINQRQIYVGSKGFIFTISTTDAEALEGATAKLNSVLKWD